MRDGFVTKVTTGWHLLILLGTACYLKYTLATSAVHAYSGTSAERYCLPVVTWAWWETGDVTSYRRLLTARHQRSETNDEYTRIHLAARLTASRPSMLHK